MTSIVTAYLQMLNSHVEINERALGRQHPETLSSLLKLADAHAWANTAPVTDPGDDFEDDDEPSFLMPTLGGHVEITEDDVIRPEYRWPEAR